MSKFYRPQRKRNLFDPKSKEPFRISRSKLELFVDCPRCFYLDRRLGVARPSGPAFSLNTAVDLLLKKEFDAYRASQTPHPLMEKYRLGLVPLKHPKMDEWRESLKGGVQYVHRPTNLLITAGVDDIWTKSRKKVLYVVEYKATAKKGEILLNEEWHNAYKRQVEIEQWLLRKNGFEVGNTTYFVYCNGQLRQKDFKNRLKFDMVIIAYDGNDNWVEEKIKEAHKCLMSDKLPPAEEDCDFCRYRKAVKKHSA